MANNPIKIFGMWLRNARKQAGFTSKETASMAVNYSPDSIGRHERGEVFPSQDDVIRYSEVYNNGRMLYKYCESCPVGRKIGRVAVERSIAEGGLRANVILKRVYGMADQLAEICFDNVIDDVERPVLEEIVETIRVVEAELTNLLASSEKEEPVPMAVGAGS